MARPRGTFPHVAFPLLDISLPTIAIPSHFLALPILAFAYRRGSSFCQATPHLRVSKRSMQSLSLTPRCIPLHLRCRSALRFAPLSHCEPVHRLAVPCPCSAMPCQTNQCRSIPMHRSSTRRLAIAAPGHAIHCASASLYLTQLCLYMATRFSTNPLHPMRNKAVPQQNLATLRLSFASPCVSMLCDADAIRNIAEPLRSLASPDFSVHRHCFTSQN